MNMVTATLYMVAKMWKQPHCLSKDDWIKKCYKYRMEYYLAIRTDEILPFGTT